MPKTKKASTSESQPQEALLVFTDGRKRVLLLRPKTHKAALDVAHRHFPSIKLVDVIFQTDQLAICDGEMTDIAPESWETVVGQLSSVFVTERHECAERNHPANFPVAAIVPAVFTASPTTDTSINIHILFQENRLSVKMKFDTPFSKIRKLLADETAHEQDDLELLYDGVRISDAQTPRAIEMEDNDSVEVFLRQRGGKPVIYLYSPVEAEVSVALTLTRDWSFSAIYPVVPTKLPPSGAGERIHWDVRTNLDGSLTELNTGLDVAYLYWEAHTNHAIPPSPPVSPTVNHITTTASFSPLTSDLVPCDSVLVAVSEITPYLDKVLLGLGLHIEARTSFITYWLPSLLKYSHVALRFVPQAAYETAASLDITPVPDVVTRVFMLFKGIPDDALGEWKDSGPTGAEAGRWRDVVGVNLDRALDTKLFRLLEWGGMEVLAR